MGWLCLAHRRERSERPGERSEPRVPRVPQRAPASPGEWASRRVCERERSESRLLE